MPNDRDTGSITVAVIIPTKDRPEGLRIAVTSALAALPNENATVIVVDDGGTIAARDTLADQNDSRLSILTNTGPSGPGGTRNFGVGHSRADLIFFLDDDDALLPDYIRNILVVIQRSDGIPRFGFSSALVGHRVFNLRRRVTLLVAETPLAQKISGLGMGFWIYRQVFLDFGGIDNSIHVNEDTDFCLKLASANVAGWFSSIPGVELRPGPPRAKFDQISITKSSSASVRARSFELILSRHAALLAHHPKTRRAFVARLVKYRARSGDTAGVRQVIKSETSFVFRLRLSAQAVIAQLA
jgi:glycosyltransferase involved in cell wall biosynthesis